MARKHETGSAIRSHHARREAILEQLRCPPPVQDLSYAGLRTVSAIRLLAICGKAGRDPLLELTQRFGRITTAKAFIAFADQVGSFWPGDVQVMRPCARLLSPDEATLAQMADAALAGDREGFRRVLSGFVRADRHDRLYDRAAQMVSQL
jgi:hypothetical protein